jgi:hypothetical protein
VQQPGNVAASKPGWNNALTVEGVEKVLMGTAYGLQTSSAAAGIVETGALMAMLRAGRW